jgi:hypothetical protein
LEIERPVNTDLEREREGDLEPERERRPRLYDRERDREGVYDLFTQYKMISYIINNYVNACLSSPKYLYSIFKTYEEYYRK